MHAAFFDKAEKIDDVMARIVNRRSADPTATLERIKALNPHVDFKRLKAGTVLILPDDPDIKTSGKGVESFGARALNELGSAMAVGFDEAAGRVRKAAADANSDRGAIAESLKSKLVRREIESDAALRKQLDSAASAAAGREKALSQAVDDVSVLAQSFFQELDAMKKLLG